MTKKINSPKTSKSVLGNQNLVLASLTKLGFSRKVVKSLSLNGGDFRPLRDKIWARMNWKVQYPVPVLIEALKDEEKEVRWHAAWVLSRIGSEAKDAVPALIEALKDEEAEIRRLVTKTLWRMGSEVEIPVSVLNEALGDRDRYVRRFASRTLAKVPDGVI
jgi:hypothetical protein